MPYLNKCLLMGYVRKGIKVKETKTNKKIYSFTLYHRQGEAKNYITIKAFDKTGERVKEGDLILVDGTIQAQSYNGKFFNNVLANRIYIIQRQEEQETKQESDEFPGVTESDFLEPENDNINFEEEFEDIFGDDK